MTTLKINLCKTCGNAPSTYIRGSNRLEASVWCNNAKCIQNKCIFVSAGSRNFKDIRAAISFAIRKWNVLQR